MANAAACAILSALSLGRCSGTLAPGRPGVGLPAPTAGVVFLDQRGRLTEGPCFVGHAGAARVGAVPGALLLELRTEDACARSVVRLTFEGADAAAELEPLDPRPGLHHFFLGNDPSRWRRNVHAFGRVCYRGLYPGIDLVLRGDDCGFEYDLLVAPGADLAQVVVRCEGIESLRLDQDGVLDLVTPVGPLHQPLGRCWQVAEDGAVQEVTVSYRPIDDERFGFDASGRDWGSHLTIDPRLVWSTYLGGRGGGTSVGDRARSVALDKQGDVTVVGTTDGGLEGGGFPMTPGTYQHPGRDYFEDVFVTKFRASDGQLIYSSLIGGDAQYDCGEDVAVDSLRRATVVGRTLASNFPTTPGAFQTTKLATTFTGFVLRLSPRGENLEYSTFLEGAQGSEAWTVALASTGAAIVGGSTSSADFPTTPGTLAPTKSPFGSDGFVTRLDPTGSFLEWSTFVGGPGPEDLFALALDSQENVAVTGCAANSFPTTPGAFQPKFNRDGDAFVARIDSTGSRFLWASYLGGRQIDLGATIAFAPNGDVVVGGDTQSIDFPTTPGAFQPSYSVGVYPRDGFLTRMDATGSRLVFSTFLGGTGDESLAEIALDPSGVITVVGSTSSFDFPLTPGAFDTNLAQDQIFVSRLDPTGSRVYYSTFLGGAGSDYGDGLAVSPTRRVTLAGYSQSRDYPTTPDALFPKPPGGSTDAVITTMDLVLQGVDQLGPASNSCLGTIDLNATEMPVAGSTSFRVYCSGAPPLADGMLIVNVVGAAGRSAFVSGRLGGASLGSAVLHVVTDATGFVERGLPLPLGSAGTQLLCRCVFQNPASCSGESPWSTSNRLLLTVQ